MLSSCQDVLGAREREVALELTNPGLNPCSAVAELCDSGQANLSEAQFPHVWNEINKATPQAREDQVRKVI